MLMICLIAFSGHAVRGPRAQIDRTLYKSAIQDELFNRTPNLTVRAGSVEDLIISDSGLGTSAAVCEGVRLDDGDVTADAVVLTTGTFLRGCINFGTQSFPAGRMGDKPALGLALTLEKLDFRLGRMKTGEKSCQTPCVGEELKCGGPSFSQVFTGTIKVN